MNIIRKTILMILSCSILSFSLCNAPAFSYQSEIYYKSWFDEEIAEKKKILEAFWKARIVQHNQKSIDDFKMAIINSHYPKDQNWENKIEQLFNDATNEKINFDLFFNTLKDQPFVLIEMMNNIEKLIPQETFKDTDPHINKYKLEKLQQYVMDKHFIVGSPAGGYWLTAKDLAKFGQWIYGKAHADPKFRRLIEKYGQEFYYADRQVIAHGGGIPSSMAFFSVSLKTGAIQAILSDQSPTQASDLKEMIIRHMFSKRIVPS